MAIENEFKQNVPIYPDPSSKDQGDTNRKMIEVIKQLWRKTVDINNSLRTVNNDLEKKISDLQNQIKRIP
jgi:hypothetical protein